MRHESFVLSILLTVLMTDVPVLVAPGTAWCRALNRGAGRRQVTLAFHEAANDGSVTPEWAGAIWSGGSHTIRTTDPRAARCRATWTGTSTDLWVEVGRQ